jgi:ATPase subunit of ABC transporter with duplicated ATPase domains
VLGLSGEHVGSNPGFSIAEKDSESRLISQGAGRVGDLHHELEALQREMSDPDKADDMDRILEGFGHVQEEYEYLGGYALESQAREVLHGLGFRDDQKSEVGFGKVCGSTSPEITSPVGCVGEAAQNSLSR